MIDSTFDEKNRLFLKLQHFVSIRRLVAVKLLQIGRLHYLEPWLPCKMISMIKNKKTYVQRGCIVLLGALALCFLLIRPECKRTKIVESQASLHGKNSTCLLIKAHYYPSPLESAWLTNARKWDGADFCQRTKKFEEETDIWIRGVEANMNSQVVENLDPRVFSYFMHDYDCGNHTKSVKSWIEPLSHGLRHPRAICGGADIVDRSYLLVDTKKANENARNCKSRECQNIMVDLGASTWNAGLGGASQSWFEKAYQKHGIEFDRFLMWEATPLADKEIFRDIPPHLWHKYQYFNLPASADGSNPASPLNIIKQIAQPGDFVVLKLDIDNFVIEGVIVQMIMADPQLVELIDEFVYEEHVQFDAMVKCCWAHTAHPNRTLHDSYQLFYSLRKLGIRAHSWV